VADRMVDTLTERFTLLAQHPKFGRARDDEFGAGRRAFPLGNYVIVYRIVGAGVRILRVLHSRRDLTAILGGD
jgi:toxin ParE1/3/4